MLCTAQAGSPGLAAYRGVADGPTPDKGLFEAATTPYLLFDRVAGGRDAEAYVRGADISPMNRGDAMAAT